MPWGFAIAAAATIGGAVITSNATSDAADAQSDASAAAIAEQRRQFDIAQANQQPWLVTGTSALNQLGSMYGLDTYQPNYTQGSATGTPNLGVVQQPVGGTTNQPNVAPGGTSATGTQSTAAIIAALTATGMPLSAATAVAGQMAGQTAPTAGTTPQAPAQPAGTYTQGSSQPGVNPYASFYQSPDYLFRLTQGLGGVDAGAAAGGSLDSGATRKAEISYAGNLAAGEYNNYANRLQALAGIGQTTATNLGSLGQGYANNIGNTMIGQGNNMASSYLAKGQNYGNAVGNLAGIGQGLIANYQGAPASYNTSTGNWMPGPGGF